MEEVQLCLQELEESIDLQKQVENVIGNFVGLTDGTCTGNRRPGAKFTNSTSWDKSLFIFLLNLPDQIIYYTYDSGPSNKPIIATFLLGCIKVIIMYLKQPIKDLNQLFVFIFYEKMQVLINITVCE